MLADGGRDAGQVIDRAFAAGVRSIITIGIDIQTSRRALEFAKKNSGVFAAVGVHPHHAGEVNGKTLAELKEMARDERVVAYGEIGIDTVKDHAPLVVQEKAFISQLLLARELGLPVVVHNREAHAEIHGLLKQHGPLPAGGVIHCFSGDGEMALKFVELGFYISIPGVVTFNKAEMLQEAVRAVPLSALLIETDAPFLAPVPFRGKTNEPAYSLYTAQKIAELKGLSLDEVARATTANAAKLFGISV
ncbi:MAG: TatD family hydrolase [Deltaproteobacteria bacterium]|nr:TatD family hydrolase [Deltaproteobacteria bacterium]